MSGKRASYVVDNEEEEPEPEPLEVVISADSMDALRAESRRQGISIDQVIDKLCASIDSEDQNGPG